jgi:chitodextrinase
MRIFRVLILAGLLAAASVAVPRTSAHPAAAGGPPISVAVTPDPMPMNTDAYVSVLTTPGASCHASVIYSTGQVPRAFQTTYYQKSYVAASNGVVAWPWHQDVSAAAGWATVTCLKGGHATYMASLFAILAPHS